MKWNAFLIGAAEEATRRQLTCVRLGRRPGLLALLLCPRGGPLPARWRVFVLFVGSTCVGSHREVAVGRLPFDKRYRARSFCFEKSYSIARERSAGRAAVYLSFRALRNHVLVQGSLSLNLSA